MYHFIAKCDALRHFKVPGGGGLFFLSWQFIVAQKKSGLNVIATH
jgi:hypothetical protein